MRISRVAFIEPKAPSKHIFSRVPMPRIGPVLLATMLKKRGLEARVYAEDISGIDWDYIKNSHLVGLSTLTSTAPRAYQIAQKIKGVNPLTPIVIGGSHVTFLPDEALHAGIDFVVRGEGEKTLLELVDYLEDGHPGMSTILGLSYNEHGTICHNSARPFLTSSELDELPIPDFSLVPKWPGEFYPVSLSRGCPYDCNFCSVIKMFGRNYRTCGLERAFEKLAHASRMTKKTVFVADDNFAANIPFTKSLLKLLIDRGVKMRWSGQMRVGIAKDAELLSLLKQAGFVRGCFGLESITPETLKEVRKKQDVKDITDCTKAILASGIDVHAMFVAFPSDTPATIEKTIEFAKEMGITTLQYLAVTPFPGTEIYDKMVESNMLLFGPESFPMAWSNFDTLKVVFKPEKLSARELRIALLRAQKHFYSLSYIVKQFTCGRKDGNIGRWYALAGIYSQYVTNSLILKDRLQSAKALFRRFLG